MDGCVIRVEERWNAYSGLNHGRSSRASLCRSEEERHCGDCKESDICEKVMNISTSLATRGIYTPLSGTYRGRGLEEQYAREKRENGPIGCSWSLLREVVDEVVETDQGTLMECTLTFLNRSCCECQSVDC